MFSTTSMTCMWRRIFAVVYLVHSWARRTKTRTMRIILGRPRRFGYKTLKVHLGPNCFGDGDKHNLLYLIVN
jgi:hypothetical protein